MLTGGLLLTALMGALMLVISGERTRIRAQVDDATARLREREARLQAILDNAADAIVTVGQHGALQSANAAAGALFGYPPPALCQLRLEQLLDMSGVDGSGASSASSAETLAKLAQDGAGARFPLSLSASLVRLGEERIFVCIIHDLTEQRRAQQHIHQLAHHDPLTGLENRFALNLHLEQLLAQAKRAGQAVALLFLDLDHFKKINDSHGHQAGDRLLVEVAQRLRELLRDADIIARLGGDEFIVVMAGALTPELVGAMAVRIVRSLSAPYQWDGKTMRPGPGDPRRRGIGPDHHAGRLGADARDRTDGAVAARRRRDERPADGGKPVGAPVPGPRAAVAPALLELEITESAAMHDPEHTRQLLRQLRERGINVAIDDFGTGYSSLAYLKLFAIDRIKIDRGFVTDIETDPNDAAIVTATVGLAHAMGLKVLAEGVETAAQRNFLRLHDCDEAQGFYFAKPMPAAQFRQFVAMASAQPALAP